MTMKNYNIKFFALSVLVSMGAVSCSLTEEPDSYYEKDTFFSSEDKAKLAVIGVYDCLSTGNHYGQFEMAMPASDDTYYIQGTGTDNTRRDIAHYMVKTTNTWVADLWKYKYQGIDRANFAIANIEAMSGYSENERLQSYVAEAKFLRAFLSLDLIKYWGDVPYKTTYTGGYDDAFQPRVSRETIYDYIIQDLDFAKNHLPAVGSVTSPETPDQVAAHALLMRVYLQRAGYSLQMDGKLTRPSDDLRKSYFEAVIDEWTAIKEKGGHGFYDGGYVELFKSYSAGILNNKESLWEIAFNPTGNSFKDNAGFWATYNGPLVDAPGCKPTENTEFMGRANAFFRVMPEWKYFFESTDERSDVMVVDYQLKWDKNLYNHKKVSKGDDAGEKEYECNLRAADAGINVAKFKLIKSKITKGFFASKRFDRIDGKRIHMASLSAILESSHRYPALDYYHLLKVTEILTHSEKETEEAFRRACFNVFIENQDDHGKNFAFLYDDGKREWHLSPAYDITSTQTSFGEHSTTVMKKGKSISSDDLRRLADEFTIKQSVREEILRDTWKAAKA